PPARPVPANPPRRHPYNGPDRRCIWWLSGSPDRHPAPAAAGWPECRNSYPPQTKRQPVSPVRQWHGYRPLRLADWTATPETGVWYWAAVWLASHPDSAIQRR